MTTDDDNTYEQQGRRFAQALLNAGYDRQTIDDASIMPGYRIAVQLGLCGLEKDYREDLSLRGLLEPTNLSSAEIRLFGNAQASFRAGGLCCD